MAEVISTVGPPLVAGVAGVTLATFIGGIDIGAVTGAFGGSLAYVVLAKDMHWVKRLGCLLVGWLGGYYFCAEALAQAWTKTSGITSFGGGLITVLVCTGVLTFAETGVLPKWMGRVLGFFTGKREQQ